MIGLFTAGAVINVAVAWGLAFVQRDEASYAGLGRFRSSDRAPFWTMSLRNGVGYSRLVWLGHATNFPGMASYEDGESSSDWWNATPPSWSAWDLGDPPPATHLVNAAEDATGWPSLSMASMGVFHLDSNGIMQSTRSAILLDSLGWNQDAETIRMIPLRPIWPGFATNTLFYAGVLWVMFAGPFALRRMIRRRRSRCPACSYPVGTSDVCTECGTPLQPRGNASRSG